MVTAFRDGLPALPHLLCNTHKGTPWGCTPGSCCLATLGSKGKVKKADKLMTKKKKKNRSSPKFENEKCLPFNLECIYAQAPEMSFLLPLPGIRLEHPMAMSLRLTSSMLQNWACQELKQQLWQPHCVDCMGGMHWNRRAATFSKGRLATTTPEIQAGNKETSTRGEE